MSEGSWIGKNKPLTSDKVTDLLEDVTGSEGVSVTVPSSNVQNSANITQIGKINAILNKPNINASSKNQALDKKFKLLNGYPSVNTPSVSVGISFEDTQALLLKMQTFQSIIVDDWKIVISQWQNLQNCWQDNQYKRFEPSFESLCRTYTICYNQCQEYIHFLEGRIRSCEDATATFNL